jgi:hypothetical protein
MRHGVGLTLIVDILICPHHQIVTACAHENQALTGSITAACYQSQGLTKTLQMMESAQGHYTQPVHQLDHHCRYLHLTSGDWGLGKGRMKERYPVLVVAAAVDGRRQKAMVVMKNIGKS